VPKLSEDLLRGARAIGAEAGLSERMTYDHLERGLIPGVKLGKIWTSSRSKLEKYYADKIDESLRNIKT
jgi:hypothetical protein